MKILLLSFAKLKYMPYLNFYLDSLKNKNIDIHILYWNRDLQSDQFPSGHYTYHEFKFPLDSYAQKHKKIFSFLCYHRFAKAVLKTEKFDKIIILHTFPGVLFFRYLTKNYKERYVFDYRDFTYENFKFFRKIIARLIQMSAATFVSSAGFKKYLPVSDKIYISHNMLLGDLAHRKERTMIPRGQMPVRVGFWGFVRNRDLNLELITKMANDIRFELHFYGPIKGAALDAKALCEESHICNVFFHGEYSPQDRYEFVQNTDILHNLYHDQNMDMAMSNKYYDGLIFYIPQLCFQNSFMGTAASNAGVGFACDPSEANFANQVYNYYKSIQWEVFAANCDRELSKIEDEYHKGIKCLQSIFDEI